MKHRQHHMWNKQEIKSVFDLWETTSVTDIAEKMDVEPSQIRNLVHTMRKVGIPITKKRKNGYLQLLLNDVKRELKIR